MPLVAFLPFRGAAADATATSDAQAWSKLPDILAHIIPPTFPDRSFVITKYGAKGDGVTDCTEAFHKAIDACHEAGGGKVKVPAGVYLTGAIHLKSNVDLDVAKGGTIRFSTDPKSYLPVVFTRYEVHRSHELLAIYLRARTRKILPLPEREHWTVRAIRRSGIPGNKSRIPGSWWRWETGMCRSNSGFSVKGIICARISSSRPDVRMF